jgi:hypothetical protein
MPRRTRPPERQLPLEWTAAMRWAHLSAEVRERVTAALRAMLERYTAQQAKRPADE